MDDSWRRHVDAVISGLQADVGVLKHGQELSRAAVAENTFLTRVGLEKIDKKIDAQIEKTEPVVKAMETMESGIHTIATIGRWGRRTLTACLYLLAIGIFIKVLFSGAGLDAAVGAFWGTASGGK